MLTKIISLDGFSSALRWKRFLALCTLLAALGMSLPASAQQPRFTTFEIPAAGIAANQGTFAIGINALGVTAGYYTDSNGVSHGFLRSPDGSITLFDPPGVEGLTGSGQGTVVYGLNPLGAVAGFYLDANFVNHSFLRAPNGSITTFDDPSAGSVVGSYQGTIAYDINVWGTIAGFYRDANDINHGFVRSPWGAFTTFDAPAAGSVVGSYQGTITAGFSGLTPFGAITGSYIDANNVYHGYLRNPDGTFKAFDPGVVSVSGDGTFPTSLNLSATITGQFIDDNNVSHGFLRTPDGNITTFEAPGSGAGPGQGTSAQNINVLGAITGYYTDANNVNHGFLRSSDGKIITFDAPGAGTGSGQGTFATSNNEAGAIAGYYVDGNGVAHGFVTCP
jgi:hypothetical protein